MKSRCSFILKALVALVLCVLMVAGSTASSFAAVVKDLADTGYYWDNGNWDLKSDITWDGIRMTNNSSNDDQSYKDIYLFGSASNSNFYFKFKEEDGDGNNSWFGPNSGSDTACGTSGTQGGEGKGGNYYINRKTLGTTATTVYKVRIWFEHASWIGAWYAKSATYTTLAPTLTVPATGTVGTPITLTGGSTDAQRVGTLTKTYQYSTDDGTSWNNLASGSYTADAEGTVKFRYKVQDGGVVSGTNSTDNRIEYSSEQSVVFSNPTTPDITAISSSSSSLKIGETATITTTLANTVSPTVTYSSSDGTVLSVTKVSNTEATIKALKPGSATITASLSDSGTTDSATTSSISVATPTIASYYYSSNSEKSLLIGEATGNPTKSLTSGTYNASSTITWKYYLSSTGTTTDNTYATINADTGVLTAKSTYAAVTSSAQNAYAVATITYNGVSYTTDRRARSYNVYAYFLMGLGGGWSKSEASMFTYDSNRSVWTNSRDLTAKTYTGDSDGFKVVKYVKGTLTYYDYTSTITMTRSDNDNITTALDSTSTGNFAITADVAGTYIFDLALTNNTTPSTIKPHYPQKVNYNKDGKTTTAFPTSPAYVTYNTAIGSAPATTPAANGYTFDNWVTASGGNTAFNFSSTKITSETTIYAKWTANTYTIDLSANGGTAGAITSVTATFGSAMPTIAAGNLPTKDGYTFAGYYDTSNATGGTKYYNSDGTSAKNCDIYNNTTTLYARWSEVTGGAVVKAYTNGSASGTGGKVKQGSGSYVASVNLSGIGITTSNTVTANPATGYNFNGWQFSGTNWNHLRYSLDNGSTWNIPSAKDTLIGSSSDTSILVRTDGTSGLTTSNAEVKAMFTVKTHTVSVTQKYYDNATIQTGNKGTISGTGSANYNASVTLSVSNVNSAYEFVGWYAVGAADDATPLNTTTSYTFTMPDSNKSVEARFRKIYYATFYKSWVDNPSGGFTYKTAPPKVVTVKNGSTTIATYTYVENASATSEGATRTATGNYNEGDKLKVLAGYTIDATYSALASSDVISGAFFNNAIRYTTANEPDNKYINGRQNNPNNTPQTYPNSTQQYYTVSDGSTGDDDWDYTYAADTTLRALPGYYDTTQSPYSTILSAQGSYIATLTQNTHTISWTAAQNYYNIDLELAEKKQFLFSDYDNTVITCDSTDNYFGIGETVTGHLSVAAAKSSNQTNTIVGSAVDFYKINADGSKTLLTAEEKTTYGISITSSTSASTDAANGTTLNISCTGMPPFSIYVDLKLAVTYSVKMATVMVSDLTNNYKTWAKVADVTVKNGSAAAVHDENWNAVTPAYEQTVNKNGSLTYTWSYWPPAASNNNQDFASTYMFTGWYKAKADGSGPDYENGFLSKKATYTYKPTGNTTVYAVGTRDLFIGGSKYLTAGDTNHWVHHKMEFDPNYYDSTNDLYGRYYYEIPYDTFHAASDMYYVGNSYGGGSTYFDNNSVLGNSFFKIFDTASGDSLSFWGQVPYTNEDHADVRYGKWYQRDDNNNLSNAYGIIAFNTTNTSPSEANCWSSYKEGYDAPLRIYAYPNHTIEVTSTYVYQHIYLSNGYKNIDNATPSNCSLSVDGTASGNNGSGSNSTQGKAYYNGAGWTNLGQEGTVRDITIQQKDATIEISKTVNSASFKVASFLVYDLCDDSVKAYTPTTVSGTTYKLSYKMETGHNLYICPIIESTSANMKVIVDATQLNRDEWGDLVGCYAWYSNDTKAYGAYPGQLMIPSDDGLSLSANFPATNGANTLAGITFSNYVDGSSTWLGGAVGDGTVMSSDIIKGNYNAIGSGDYAKTNCKVQTYDYREPVAFYANRDPEATSFLMNFALKSGNSDQVRTSRHGELTAATIPGTFQHTHSDGSTKSTYTFSKSDFEYLTTADGNTYADLNGVPIDGKPTASFYVIAKGQSTYSSGSLVRSFYSGNNYDTVTGVTYPNTGSAAGASVSQGYAVEWYVYDSSGRYITNILSAGYADKTAVRGDTTLIGQKLLDEGYAIDGKTVAICYDTPRYCYGEGGSPSVVNGGSSFDAYRLSGQWYQQNAYAKAKVYAEVGMLTDNGEELAGSSTASYGSATVSIDLTKLSHAAYGGSTGSEGGVNYGEACIADGDKQAIALTASSMNFAGWYYYDADGKFVQLTDETELTINPTFSKDVTYYAMYQARATYAYQYEGREGTKAYNVDGGELTEAEMNGTATGCSEANQVATDRNDFGTKSPDSSVVSIFKKTITFNNTVTAAMLNNSDAYTMKISNATVTPQNFTVTAHYKDSTGELQTMAKTGAYNTAVDFTTLNSGVPLGSLYTGHRFIGWYECNSSGGEIASTPLTTQANFGMVITKDMHIIAVYEGEGKTIPTDDNWTVYIDDHEVTREKYTATSGTYYNDTILRIRNNAQNIGGYVSLPEGAEIGILVIDANNSGLSTTASSANLTKFANGMNSGDTYKIGSTGRTVTKVTATNLTGFGRVDLATRKDFSVADGTGYSVYAYYKSAGGAYSFTLVNTGTYTVA